jgi:hypothetical protein
MIELLVNQGLALIELNDLANESTQTSFPPPKDDDETNLRRGSTTEQFTLPPIHLDQLIFIYRSLQKWIDINDEKASKFLLKFLISQKFYGKALKILMKNMDEKVVKSNDELIITVNSI